jgi:hypothetical protein
MSTSPTFGYSYANSPVFTPSYGSPGFSSASPRHTHLLHYGSFKRDPNREASLKEDSHIRCDTSDGCGCDSENTDMDKISNVSMSVDIGKALSLSDNDSEV